MLQRLQRPGLQDDNEASKPAMAGVESDDGDVEAGELPPAFPKSLNDFYKGQWYATIDALHAQPRAALCAPRNAVHMGGSGRQHTLACALLHTPNRPHTDDAKTPPHKQGGGQRDRRAKVPPHQWRHRVPDSYTRTWARNEAHSRAWHKF